jgi:DHA3 family tetracycline resistance protein-like MFS transporter
MPVRAWRLDAAAIFLVAEGFGAFFQSVIYTVLAVYYVTVVGMNPFQLVLVGTVLEAAAALFEVPTGVIADVVSRRLSIVLGHLLFGVAFLLEGSVPLFAIILVAEVIRAVGESCLSGATQAWLADEVGEDRIGILFVRASQLRRVGGLLGIVVSVGLASIELKLPVLLGGGLAIVLAGCLSVTMPEHGFRPLQRTGWRPDLRRTATEGIRQLRLRPLLLVFLGIAATAGASSEGFDRLWEAHFLASFVFPDLGDLEPIVWFGIIDAVAALLSIGVAQAMTRLDLTDDRVVARYAVLANGGWLVAVSAFGLAPNFALALLAYWGVRIMKGVRQPLMSIWVTRTIPSRVRATVLSTLSQGDALGQMLGGPVVGAIGTAYSLRAAMVVTSLFHAPVLLLLLRARRLLDASAPTPASAPDSTPGGALP